MNPGAAARPAAALRATPAPCLLLNPKSFEAARGALAQAAVRLAQAHGLELVRASRPDEFAAAVERWVEADQRLVYVIGGDGTVQALADLLVALPRHVARPQLVVLGGGRSNVTAAELGGTGEALQRFERALQGRREGRNLATQARDLLCIEQRGLPSRHGFLMLAGWLDQAIRSCHRYRSHGGALRQSNAATLWSVGRLALPRALGGMPPALDALCIAVEGYAALPAPAHMFIATTLQHRHGVVAPFAARGNGPVRFTAVSARGIGMWARLPALVAGRFTHTMDPQHGYLSGRCEALQLRGLSSYTLDGEEFECDPARPVTIRKGPSLSFVTP